VNKLVPGMKETQEVILMAIAVAQLAMQIKEVVDDQNDPENKGFNWLSFIGSFPTLFPTIGTAISAVKDGIDNVEEVTIEFTTMTHEQQEELKAWVLTQVPDLPQDKTEQFIKDAFAVVIDIWMIIKTYFLKPADENTASETNTTEETAE